MQLLSSTRSVMSYQKKYLLWSKNVMSLRQNWGSCRRRVKLFGTGRGSTQWVCLQGHQAVNQVWRKRLLVYFLNHSPVPVPIPVPIPVLLYLTYGAGNTLVELVIVVTQWFCHQMGQTVIQLWRENLLAYFLVVLLTCGVQTPFLPQSQKKSVTLFVYVAQASLLCTKYLQQSCLWLTQYIDKNDFCIVHIKS